VVPTIAMISRIEVELTPPWIPGTKKSCPIGPALMCAMKNSGISSRLPNTNTNMARSQERKLPLAVMPISAAAATGTATYLDTPK